ncbi:MAG: hypothetical protein JW852_06940, partial [Spirochaetales bacterium]|nr:hypothetical protein [Spirochaetales bacterium]
MSDFTEMLIKAVQKQDAYAGVLRRITLNQYPCEIEGPDGLHLATVLSRLHTVSGRSSLVVMPTEIEAESLVRDLQLLNADSALFPWTGTAPYSSARPHSGISGARIQVLSRLLDGTGDIIVTSLRGFLGAVPEKRFLEGLRIHIETGGKFDPIALENKLSVLGYLRVPQVSVHGEFALRGEVLDIFPSGMDHAVRFVFGFDEVEDIRLFNPLSQVSMAHIDDFTIYPQREIVWTDEAVAALRSYLESRKDVSEETWEIAAHAGQDVENEGENLLFAACFESPGCIIDYLPEKSFLFLIHSEHLTTSNEALKKEYRELYIQARSRLRYFVPPVEKNLIDFDKAVSGHERVFIFPAIKSPRKDGSRFV